MPDQANRPGEANPSGSPSPPGLLATVLSSLRRLPDTRAAIEGVILFMVVVAAGIWAVQTKVLALNPAPRDSIGMLSLSAFFLPALGEELVFRSWLPRGGPLAAVASFLAFVFWHPLQLLLHLPLARPEFTDAGFLGLVAWLGLACTLARVRSGSLWPGVVIHWGVVVLWLAVCGGAAVQPA